MNACSVDECSDRARARTLCHRHYSQAYAAAGYSAETLPPTTWAPNGWVNPMVCVCAVPDAHPRIDFGMCQRCHRCPLVNFRILQKETAA